MDNQMPVTADAVATLPIDGLHDLRVDLEQQLQAAKARVQVVQDEITRRFLPDVQAAFDREAKQHGTVRSPAVGGYSIKGDVSRTVKYDQDQLKAMAAEMTWQDIQHFFKIVFDVPAKVFDGLPPSDPRKAKLEAARTVRYGEPKVTLVGPEAEVAA